MKLRFEPDLDFQIKAVDAVCDLFRGQEIARSEFSLTPSQPHNLDDLTLSPHEHGFCNQLSLLDEDIKSNLLDIQLRNGLPQSNILQSGDFTIEMETGTGKTYVYLRTIFELNKRYGFSKFIIVVPSIAIKEGVYKTIQVTEEHFRSIYSGVPFDYFLYDSNKLGQVRNFVFSNHIQIMIITVGAINKKDVNNLYKDSEKTGGERPIDLIKATNPIIIVDEPQSVDGGLKGQGKAALESMMPLCTLRYSATHIYEHHMIYRLHAVDAYERRLVKQIEVASAIIEDAHNKPFVQLISTSSRNGNISAKVELDVETSNGINRQNMTVYDGEDLEQITGRAIYHNCFIGEISVERDREVVELRVPNNEIWLRPGDRFGEIDSIEIQRQKIRRTIQEHLDKEKRLLPLGIKVLSLFFVDAVENYRVLDNENKLNKGEYALIFEEEYSHFAKSPTYRELFVGMNIQKEAEKSARWLFFYR